ncbi:MAG: phosphonoacetaldehyde hydrolase [Clostridium sp.]|uniref:phosphonoacetaldehyde hydrolase n=1 Tax=Clostridium sp. TaxID=1506 RepID=UPI003F405DB7
MRELKNIKGIVVDWAGTMVDYGCMAPLNVFVKVFKDRGITISNEEARGPMGLKKIDHIRELSKLQTVKEQFRELYGREVFEEDVVELYSNFEPQLLSILRDYTEPIDGALDLVNFVRTNGLKVGSTSGYTKNMMEIVKVEAKNRGYAPDYIVAADELKEARPYPYMIYINAMELKMYPLCNVVKIGDTISDVLEGKNAGTWTIAILKGGSEVGMSIDKVETLPLNIQEDKINKAKESFKKVRPDYIVESLKDVVSVLKEIDERIENGEYPKR